MSGPPQWAGWPGKAKMVDLTDRSKFQSPVKNCTKKLNCLRDLMSGEAETARARRRIDDQIPGEHVRAT